MAGAWRYVLCDRQGRAIEDVTGLATRRAFNYRLLLPAQLAGVVPADDEKIAGRHTDGFPKLETGRRTIKGYRRELVPALGEERYVLRFNGIVWSLQDVGDEDTATTAFVCRDPLVRLAKRYVREANGDRGRVTFTNRDGALIGRDMVDRTNTYAGASGITTSGNVQEATPPRTMIYDDGIVFAALLELASAYNGFDYELVPLDRADGVMARIDFYAKRGVVRPDVLLAWGAPPANVKRVEKLEDMEAVLNYLTGLGATQTGGDQLRAESSSPGSISDFGQLEGYSAYSDITIQTFLNALVQDELVFRVAERELVQITPQPGSGLSPWEDFWLGDYLPIVAGARLRGGFTGYQRVFGFDLADDDDRGEIVNAIYAQREGS